MYCKCHTSQIGQSSAALAEKLGAPWKEKLLFAGIRVHFLLQQGAGNQEVILRSVTGKLRAK